MRKGGGTHCRLQRRRSSCVLQVPHFSDSPRTRRTRLRGASGPKQREEGSRRGQQPNEVEKDECVRNPAGPSPCTHPAHTLRSPCTHPRSPSLTQLTCKAVEGKRQGELGVD